MFQLQLRYTGIEFGKNFLRIAALRKTRMGWTVSSLKEIATKANTHQLLKDDLVISAIHTRDVLMRNCEIPLKKQKDIFATLDFHVEPLLPYSLEKAVVQAKIAEQQDNSSFLNVFSVRKDHLAHHLDTLKNFSVDAE